jgi:hypothetical protein
VNLGRLFILLGIAVLAIVTVVGLTRPVRVEPATSPEPTPTETAATDGGALDSMLDAVRIEHQMKHGR